VVKAIQYPERVDRGHSYFAIKAINAEYALRVVYEERKLPISSEAKAL